MGIIIYKPLWGSKYFFLLDSWLSSWPERVSFTYKQIIPPIIKMFILLPEIQLGSILLYFKIILYIVSFLKYGYFDSVCFNLCLCNYFLNYVFLD